jgi:menaquinol-cytochrome c reductase iron-sulfur subunit
MNHATEDLPREPNDPERRSFFVRVAAMIVGGIVAVFPFAAGWGVFVDPLKRGRNGSADGDEENTAGLVRICPLESLPADGLPHDFVVTTDVVDAWSHAVNQRVGEVFLTRTDVDGKARVKAFTASCPHLGCAVEFDAGDGRFKCPCHESGFGTDGQKMFGPSLRGLDSLEVKLIDANGAQHIWVRFQRFRPGIAERIPVA